MSRSYNVGIGDAVAVHKPMPDIPLGAVEILTYFPHHTKYSNIAMRLYRGGWRPRSLGKVQLHARDTLDLEELGRRDASFRHQIKTAGKRIFDDDAFAPTKAAYRDRAEVKRVPSTQYPIVISAMYNPHYNGQDESGNIVEDAPFLTDFSLFRTTAAATLADVANGVINHPTGQDAGLLTQVIRWAEEENALHLFTTDDVPHIIDRENWARRTVFGEEPEFVLPAEARDFHWDCRAKLRADDIPYPTV